MKRFFSVYSIIVLSFHSLFAFSQTFKEVKIGSQVWMAENLHVFYFRNGDPIPIVKTEEDWKKAGENQQPACCYYENKADNGNRYGLLYNWYAVNDPRGLAPKGWHIPSENEWNVLTDFLGGDKIAGNKMKSTSGWSLFSGEVTCDVCKNWTPQQKAGQPCVKCNDTRKIKTPLSGNGTIESGFSGLPSGFRYLMGTFGLIGNYGYWWSSAENYTGYAWYRGLYYDYGYVGRDYGSKSNGLSVRCLRD